MLIETSMVVKWVMVFYHDCTEGTHTMNTVPISLSLPQPLYHRIEQWAQHSQRPVEEVLIQALETIVYAGLDSELTTRKNQHVQDTTYPSSINAQSMIDAYSKDIPLIDNIPIQDDLELYMIAKELGANAVGLHAWEIAPDRYDQGEDGLPVRRNPTVPITIRSEEHRIVHEILVEAGLSLPLSPLDSYPSPLSSEQRETLMSSLE